MKIKDDANRMIVAGLIGLVCAISLGYVYGWHLSEWVRERYGDGPYSVGFLLCLGPIPSIMALLAFFLMMPPRMPPDGPK